MGPSDQPSQEGNVSMAPIGLSVAADLGKLAPKLATSDSSFGGKIHEKAGSCFGNVKCYRFIHDDSC